MSVIIDFLIDKAVPGLFTATPFVVKHYLDYRRQTKEGKIIRDGIRETNKEILILKDDVNKARDEAKRDNQELKLEFKEFRDDHDFRGGFKDSLRIIANSYSSRAGLEGVMEAFIMTLADKLETISSRFYYSKLRGKQPEAENLEELKLISYFKPLNKTNQQLSDFLETEFSSMVTGLKNLVKNNDESKEVGEKVYWFSTWIEKSLIFNEIENLRIRLKDNGFKTNMEFGTTFTNFSISIFNEYIRTVNDWNKLK